MQPATFTSQTLAEIFRDLYLGEKSGVLHLVHHEGEKRIYFDRGMVLYAESALEDEDLGRRLVNEGKISPGALAEARRNINEPKDLAQTLVNRGLIGKEALSFTVRYIVERVVQSAFRWERGTARFNEGWLLQEIFESDILVTFEVILKGISTMVGFEPIRDALRAMDSRLKVRPNAPVPMERLALSPAHGFILSQVDGSTRIADVLSLLPPGEDDLACRFLYGLIVTGVMDFDPPVGEGPFRVETILRDHADAQAMESLQEKQILAAYETIRGKSPHEILDLPPNPPRGDVERAYEMFKDRFSRDRLLPKVRDRLRSELAHLESSFVEAYLVLGQTRRGESSAEAGGTKVAEVGAGDLLVRIEMDKTKTKMAIEENSRLADGYFAKAKKFHREADFHNAIQYAKLAISYHALDARYYFLLAECQARNPDAKWQRLAEQNYQKAAELDGWNAEYKVCLGRFYKRRGLKLRARKQFEEALQVVPGHTAATEELATID